MKVSPILFSAPMVRALLDGRKTQTRRVLKEQEHELMPWRIAKTPGGPATYEWRSSFGRHVGYVAGLHCPGDVLWVRETCRAEELTDGTDGVRMIADGSFCPIRNTPLAAIDWLDLISYRGGNKTELVGPTVPTIHMPRWASRLTLVVTDVRVQRLQEISEEDARAEGFPLTWDGKLYDPPPPEVDSWQGYGRASFALYWSKLNGPGSLQANPWVAAYTFTVHVQNVDTFLAERSAA